MKLENSMHWFCDECGEKIESPKEGWVEWLATDKNGIFRAEVVRIVHNDMTTGRKCRLDVTREYNPRQYQLMDNYMECFLTKEGFKMIEDYRKLGEFSDDQADTLIRRLKNGDLEPTPWI